MPGTDVATPPFHRLLLASEHTEQDAGAEAVALALARRCGLGLAGVMPLTTNAEYEMVAPGVAAQADARAAQGLAALRKSAADSGVVLDLEVRRGPEPYQEILADAVAREADLIVIRRRGRKGLLANLLVGEMVGKVVAHAPCNVLVVPRDATMWRHRILLGVDPLAPDRQALEVAAAVASACALPLHVVCVAAEGNRSQDAARAVLDATLPLGRALQADTTGEVRGGRAHESLLSAAADVSADLLVVGRHGGSRLARAWIGGTAQKVIGLATSPVLVLATHKEPQKS
jgi:nucleotide-binding universal stress UspA family protein